MFYATASIVVAGLIGLMFLGFSYAEKNSRGKVVLFIVSILSFGVSMASVFGIIRMAYIGYPAESALLKENSVYQLVWQGDVGDKHIAALVERSSALELAEESDEEVRFYELEQPLPQEVVYFKAVKEGDKTTLVPLSLEPPKKSEGK